MPLMTHEWQLAARPHGEPTPDDFRLVETEHPDPRDGEVVVRMLVMSVDPYMRGRMRAAKSYAASWEVGATMQGGAVGRVVDSRSPPSRWARWCSPTPGGGTSPCSRPGTSRCSRTCRASRRATTWVSSA